MFTAIKMQPIAEVKAKEPEKNNLMDTAISSSVPQVEEVNTNELKEVPRFLGSRIFVDENTRTSLPVLKPELKVPIWDIVKKVIRAPDI
jgi:hypothetical protein